MSVEKLDFSKVTKEQTPYTVILNSVIQCISSLEASGLWVYLYSLPQDWKITKEHLKDKFNVGDDKLKAIFSYLNRANLIEYTQERQANGSLGAVVIHVLCGDKFDANQSFKKAVGVELTPAALTAGGLTTPPENHTCGSGALQKKELTKETKTTKETLILPTWLPKTDWQDFIDHRKHIKAPLSDNAVKRAIKTLESLRHKGQNVSKVIDQSIVNGWKGFFAVKEVPHEKPKSAAAVHFDTFKHSLKGTKYDSSSNPFKD